MTEDAKCRCPAATNSAGEHELWFTPPSKPLPRHCPTCGGLLSKHVRLIGSSARGVHPALAEWRRRTQLAPDERSWLNDIAWQPRPDGKPMTRAFLQAKLARRRGLISDAEFDGTVALNERLDQEIGARRKPD